MVDVSGSTSCDLQHWFSSSRLAEDALRCVSREWPSCCAFVPLALALTVVSSPVLSRPLHLNDLTVLQHCQATKSVLKNTFFSVKRRRKFEFRVMPVRVGSTPGFGGASSLLLRLLGGLALVVCCPWFPCVCWASVVCDIARSRLSVACVCLWRV